MHGWTIGLFFCSGLSFIMQSVPFGALLVLVFVAIWIPDSRLNMLSRIAALIVTVLLSVIVWLFNVVAAASSIETSQVFVYLGLELLSPFAAYAVATAVTISTLALHWRWRDQAARDSEAALWAWVAALLPGHDELSLRDDLRWRDGALLCDLLRALDSSSSLGEAGLSVAEW